jgi:anti-sigma B factor antagonist
MTVIKVRFGFLTLLFMSFESPLTFARNDKANGTSVFRIVGPLTIRNLFEIQAALRTDPLPQVTVVDLSEVPYMDSAGMGVIVNSYVHSINHGAQFFAVGVCDRVRALFEVTRVDKLIPMRDTADGL